MKKIALVLITLLTVTAVSAEVVRTIGDNINDNGGQFVIEKQTPTRLKFRGGVYNRYDYRSDAPQQGRFYTPNTVTPQISGRFYSSPSGATIGSIGVYRENTEAKDPAEVESRATRGFHDDSNAPFQALRNLFRFGSYWNQ